MDKKPYSEPQLEIHKLEISGRIALEENISGVELFEDED